MKMFAYYEPATIQEACELLEQWGEEVQFMAGGTDVLVKMKREQLVPSHLINLKYLRELHGSKRLADRSVWLGALKKVSDLADDSYLNREFPALTLAAKSLGTPQIRNRATLGGNICNASPAADLIPPLLVYGAVAHVISSSGTRTVDLAQLFRNPGQIMLQRGELLSGITLPAPLGQRTSCFLKHGIRKAHEIAIVNVAVALTKEETGRLIKVNIALGAVGPTVLLVTQAGELLLEKQLSENSIQEAAQVTAQYASPISDVRASAEYRREIVKVLTARALRQAWS